MYKLNRVLLLILVVCLTLGLTGCGKDKLPSPKNVPVISLQDDYGRTIKLDRIPQRIVSLSPAHTEILFALGLDSRIVGVTDYCDYPAEAKKKPKVGGYLDPNLEEIINIHPDLVVADSLNEEAVKQLEKAGIQVLALNPHDLDAVLKTINKIGQATGSEESAEALVSKIQKQISDVQNKVKTAKTKPRVYYEIWSEPLMAAGPGTVINDLINLAGGVNIAGDAGKEYPEYSVEVLVKKDPEVMIHSYGHAADTPDTNEILNRPGWQKVSCIKNKKIYQVEANLVTRPGPRVGQALQEIAPLIHPELFTVNKEGDK